MKPEPLFGSYLSKISRLLQCSTLTWWLQCGLASSHCRHYPHPRLHDLHLSLGCCKACFLTSLWSASCPAAWLICYNLNHIMSLLPSPLCLPSSLRVKVSLPCPPWSDPVLPFGPRAEARFKVKASLQHVPPRNNLWPFLHLLCPPVSSCFRHWAHSLGSLYCWDPAVVDLSQTCHLYMLFSLPGMLFPQIIAWHAPSLLRILLKDLFFREAFPDCGICNCNSCLPSLHPFLIYFSH